MTVTRYDDMSGTWFVLSGPPGVEQVEVHAEAGPDGEPDAAAVDRALALANRLAVLLREE